MTDPAMQRQCYRAVWILHRAAYKERTAAVGFCERHTDHDRCAGKRNSNENFHMIPLAFGLETQLCLCAVRCRQLAKVTRATRNGEGVALNHFFAERCAKSSNRIQYAVV